MNLPKTSSQITFLQHDDLAPIADFYQNVMRPELVEDPGGYSFEVQQFLRPASAAIFHT